MCINIYICVCVDSHRSCTTLCDPMDCSRPGSPVHGISQAGTLGWVAISSSGDLPDAGIEPASLFFFFFFFFFFFLYPLQYSGLDEPASLKSPALTGRFFTPSATWEARDFKPMGLQKNWTLSD